MPEAAAPPRPRVARASNTVAGQKKSRSKLRDQKGAKLRDALAGLTAAAEVLTAADKKKLPGNDSLTRTWQHAAFGYVHVVPELGAAVMYVGNCLARIQIKVGKRNLDGTVEAIPDGVDEIDPDTNKPREELPAGVTPEIYALAQQVAATVRSKIGGQSELLRSYGEKIFVAGEMYLIPEDSPAGPVFESLSPMELSKDGDKWVRFNGPGAGTSDLDDGIEPIRIHRPDPQFGRLATSSIRSCLEILEELVILTRLVRSAAISRMALSGILAIAEEFDDPIIEDGEDGQTSEATSPLAVDIITTGAKAIDDPSSAAAWLPYILQGPMELIKDGIRFIEFKHDDALGVVKREEALQRFAQGADLPVEVILGHQQTTFANAAQINEDTFKIHIEPTVQMFVDAITLGVLWPGMAIKKGLQPEDVRTSGYPEEILSVALTYDADELISRPDRTKDIIEAFKADPTQMAFRLSELREAVGLEGDGLPDDAEVAKRLDAIRLSKIRENVDPGAAGAATPITEGDVVPAEPVVPVAASAGLSASNALAQRIIGGADVTLERCAERIGSNIRTKAKAMQTAAAKRGAPDGSVLELAVIEGVPNREVARCIGSEMTVKLLNGSDPISAELAAFARTVAKWAADAGHAQPGLVAQTVSALITNAVPERLYGAADGLPPTVLASIIAAI